MLRRNTLGRKDRGFPHVPGRFFLALRLLLLSSDAIGERFQESWCPGERKALRPGQIRRLPRFSQADCVRREHFLNYLLSNIFSVY
jgi:hypothetical protein